MLFGRHGHCDEHVLTVLPLAHEYIVHVHVFLVLYTCLHSCNGLKFLRGVYVLLVHDFMHC